MIQVSAASFDPFLAAFSIANGAGAGPLPVGGNEFLLDEGTDPDVVDEIADVPDVTVTGRPQLAGPKTSKKHTRSSGSKE